MGPYNKMAGCRGVHALDVGLSRMFAASSVGDKFGVCAGGHRAVGHSRFPLLAMSTHCADRDDGSLDEHGQLRPHRGRLQPYLELRSNDPW